jgi:hypothetical protein
VINIFAYIIVADPFCLTRQKSQAALFTFFKYPPGFKSSVLVCTWQNLTEFWRKKKHEWKDVTEFFNNLRMFPLPTLRKLLKWYTWIYQFNPKPKQLLDLHLWHSVKVTRLQSSFREKMWLISTVVHINLLVNNRTQHFSWPLWLKASRYAAQNTSIAPHHWFFTHTANTSHSLAENWLGPESKVWHLIFLLVSAINSNFQRCRFWFPKDVRCM